MVVMMKNKTKINGFVFESDHGTAVFTDSDSVSITKCTFRNYDVIFGASLLNLRGLTANVDSCNFTNNKGNPGSMISFYPNSPSVHLRISTSLFKNNVGHYAGAINQEEGYIDLTSSTFINNTAPESNPVPNDIFVAGSAIFSYQSSTVTPNPPLIKGSGIINPR